MLLSRSFRRVRLSTFTNVRFLSGKGPTSGPSDSGSAEIWDWVPPATQVKRKDDTMNYVIPAIEGVNLTAEEVRLYLESQGAEDALIIDVNGALDNFRKLVIASGRSTRHIRKMTESVVAAMKERKLRNTGVEGDREDDWQLVNCNTFLVHVMLPNTRKMVDLESHWRMKERPVLVFSDNEAAYEAKFAQLLERFPCPEDYIKTEDIIGSDPVVKEF